MIRATTSILTLVFTFSLMLHEIRADWPQFRGPAGNGHIGKMSHPLEWSSEKNVAWSQSIPGGGWSSPIVVGDRVYVTAAVDPDNTKPMGFAGGVRNMRGKKPDTSLDFKLLCSRFKSTLMHSHSFRVSHGFAGGHVIFQSSSCSYISTADINFLATPTKKMRKGAIRDHQHS